MKEPTGTNTGIYPGSRQDGDGPRCEDGMSNRAAAMKKHKLLKLLLQQREEEVQNQNNIIQLMFYGQHDAPAEDEGGPHPEEPREPWSIR
jgi:hypothetical protein